MRTDRVGGAAVATYQQPSCKQPTARNDREAIRDLSSPIYKGLYSIQTACGYAVDSLIQLCNNLMQNTVQGFQKLKDPKEQNSKIQNTRLMSLLAILGTTGLLTMQGATQFVQGLSNNKGEGPPSLAKFIELFLSCSVFHTSIKTLSSNSPEGFKDNGAALQAFGLFMLTHLYNSIYSDSTFGRILDKLGVGESMRGFGRLLAVDKHNDTPVLLPPIPAIET